MGNARIIYEFLKIILDILFACCKSLVMPTKKCTIQMEEADFKLARRVALDADKPFYTWAGDAVAEAAKTASKHTPKGHAPKSLQR